MKYDVHVVNLSLTVIQFNSMYGNTHKKTCIYKILCGKIEEVFSTMIENRIRL